MDYQRNDRFCPACRALRGQGYSSYTPTVPRCDEAREGCRREECENSHAPLNTVENPTSIAMVFSPKQCFQNLYEPMKALSRGTLFADLDKPFKGSCR